MSSNVPSGVQSTSGGIRKRPLEILEFFINHDENGERVEKSFAINVIRVKEIIKRPSFTKIIDTDPSIVGLFNLRDTLIPLIDLPGWLGLSSEGSEAEVVIVTELSESFNGFMVSGIKKIHHLSWDDVKVPDKIDKESAEFIAGIISLKGHLIMVLDFETILAKIGRSKMLPDISRFEALYSEERENFRVLVVDDSVFSRDFAEKVFTTVGYNVIGAENGVEAYRILETRKDLQIDFILTDLEMPQMDGQELLERVKSNSKMADIPGLIITSLSNAVSLDIAKQTSNGGPLMLSKSDMVAVVEAVDGLLGIEINKLTSQWDAPRG